MDIEFNSVRFVLIGFVLAAVSVASAMWFGIWWLGLGAVAALPIALHWDRSARSPLDVAQCKLNRHEAELVSGAEEFYAVVAGYLVTGKPIDMHYYLVSRLATAEAGSDQISKAVQKARSAGMLVCELNALQEVRYRSDRNDVVAIAANRTYTCCLPQRRNRKQLLALLSHEGFREDETSTRRCISGRPMQHAALALTIAFSGLLLATALGFASPQVLPLASWQDAEGKDEVMVGVFLAWAALSQAYLYLVKHLSAPALAAAAALLAGAAGGLLCLTLWANVDFIILRRSGQSD